MNVAVGIRLQNFRNHSFKLRLKLCIKFFHFKTFESCLLIKEYSHKMNLTKKRLAYHKLIQQMGLNKSFILGLMSVLWLI